MFGFTTSIVGVRYLDDMRLLNKKNQLHEEGIRGKIRWQEKENTEGCDFILHKPLQGLYVKNTLRKMRPRPEHIPEVGAYKL